ncbi:hypothetical protein PR048_019692 [Dryococelus australis]|uniref:Reverse transcriptase domain-containing protein n=1 Tax=Dryococelus australis TaxID=614101 RepID=A0ABQ9H475_9NEOP|nr:hypothetical protein PR048_019692 [Dryococelus australis]
MIKKSRSHQCNKELFPAYDERCHVCNIWNDFASVCKQQENRQDGKICRLDKRPIDGVISTNTKKRWNTDLKMGDQRHIFKGTGAIFDVVSFKDYSAIVGRNIYRTEDINIDRKLGSLTKACVQLCHIQSRGSHTKGTIMPRHPDLFKYIVCLSGKHHLEIDTDAKPVQQPPHRYTLVLRLKVKEKLAEMIKDKIRWETENVLGPTIEEILPELTDTKQISVLDVKQGFWNMQLHAVSSRLTTYWGPDGEQYKWLQNPFWNFDSSGGFPEGTKMSCTILSELLRQLTCLDTTWVWYSAQQQAFVNVKTSQYHTSGTILSLTGTSGTTSRCEPKWTRHHPLAQWATSFSRIWDFQQSTSSPYISWGNGNAETSVKKAKNIMNKFLQNKSDPWLALLEWLNIYTACSRTSPMQQLDMSRRTRLEMPTYAGLLKSRVPEWVPKLLGEKKEKNNSHYDTKARDLPELMIGQEVYNKPVTQAASKLWSPGIIIYQFSSHSYEDTTKKKTRVRLNREALRSANSSIDTTAEDQGLHPDNAVQNNHWRQGTKQDDGQDFRGFPA